MSNASAGSPSVNGYHAHVYYNAETRPRAERLRETIAATLGVEVRELSDEPRGPHPVPQFRFTFTTAQFGNIVPWLMLNLSSATSNIQAQTVTISHRSNMEIGGCDHRSTRATSPKQANQNVHGNHAACAAVGIDNCPQEL